MLTSNLLRKIRNDAIMTKYLPKITSHPNQRGMIMETIIITNAQKELLKTILAAIENDDALLKAVIKYVPNIEEVDLFDEFEALAEALA